MIKGVPYTHSLNLYTLYHNSSYLTNNSFSNETPRNRDVDDDSADFRYFFYTAGILIEMTRSRWSKNKTAEDGDHRDPERAPQKLQLSPSYLSFRPPKMECSIRLELGWWA